MRLYLAGVEQRTEQFKEAKPLLVQRENFTL